LPIVTVLLLKGLGFIDSIQLHTQKDRIIPYVACITFFFWSFYVSKKLGDPSELTAFLLSAFIASSASLIINNYMKVSMHAMGVGGLTAFFSLLLFANRLDDVFSLLLVFFIAGITTTSRFIVSDHKPAEITVGFVTGVLIQVIAWFIIR
jgi:phosphate starvation-inducible membrane PsiE